MRKVAVIGAGLAGLSAVAMLAGLGFEVDVYETEGDVLERQRGATHRLVHPTISRWPMEPLSLTTELPFFDWGVAPCESILFALRMEWKRFYGPRSRLEKRVTFIQATVDHIAPNLADGTVSLVLADSQEDGYGTVIVATGYGTEVGTHGVSVTSYWTPDQLEEKRRSGRKFVVGGCGDGGLIDALRLAHAHFSQSWQAFALAAEIDREAANVARIIERAEYDALMMVKSIRAQKRPEEPHEAESNVQAFLFEEYGRAVAGLPPAIEKVLKASLSARPGPRAGDIKLVGMEAKPTTPFAAPIHKLMIVHAILCGHIEWIPGRLVVSKPGVPRVGTQILRSHEVIQRYGAGSSLATLIETNEADSLRLRQLMLADRIESGIKREAEAPSGYPKRDVSSLPFIDTRHEAAKTVTMAVDPRYAVDATSAGFHYVQLNDSSVPLAASGAASGISLPAKLFGITAQQGALKTDAPLGGAW